MSATKKRIRPAQSQANPTITAVPTTMTPRLDIPFWVDSTTPEHAYRLVLLESADAAHDEDIDLTRDEYIALKKQLAGMRGYKVGHVTEKHACIAELAKSLPAEYRQKDEQQNARHLQNARIIYRHCSDLVVFESEKLDQSLQELAD